jgi:decaprenylphospho-beta-D-ribofuranose 2-oxidase
VHENEPGAGTIAIHMGRSSTHTLAGWGGVGVPASERRSEDLRILTRGLPLSRGLGRSYGDSSLPPPGNPVAANTTLADRILAFDAETALVRAEAGLALTNLHRVLLPRGFFTPVSPGTQFVTLGGAVAADVHGKNHHVAGCFGAHVASLILRVADGRTVMCSPTIERDLFRATVGGMGLTGHILEVEFRMERVPSPWIDQETERVPDIDVFLETLDRTAREWPFSVGWIDCLSSGASLGRGILFRGRWAADGPPVPPAPPRRPAVPFGMPGFVLSRPAVRAFNELYYRLPRPQRSRVGPEPFFYPLDAIGHWNRLYGRHGFTQYQCVIPRAAGREAVRGFLEVLVKRGGASFLCVIKDCGAEGIGLLSFPKAGISIALDIAIRRDTQSLVDALNERVIAVGGRMYLAKDTFTRAEDFRRMEPRLPEWQAIRQRWDPALAIRSAQSVRLLGDPS